jgi:hypothetical protein
MEPLKLILLSLPFLAIFALGWLSLTIIVGIRAGIEAGLRLFLLGVGLFVAFLAIIAILLYSPDWLAVALMLAGALWPWISMLQYLINIRRSGDLLLALPSKQEKWSNSLIGGIVSVLFGLPLLIFENPLISIKSYALGILLISWGVFATIKRIRYSQIREKGILSENGQLYHWENIESFVWKFGEDKLTLRLQRFLFSRNINLRLSSQFRHEAVAYLSRNISDVESNGQGYIPSQKAG